MAAERDLIFRNPAPGRRRQVCVREPHRSYLDTAEHIAALLDAAGELAREARAGRRHISRRAMLATLTFAGLRVDELLALRWGDVDLAAGRLHLGRAKTDAGVRHVRLRPVLRDELGELKARTGNRRPEAFVFATSTGGAQAASHVRRRVLAKAVQRADERLKRDGSTPMPEKLTPHPLRRTFASVL